MSKIEYKKTEVQKKAEEATQNEELNASIKAMFLGIWAFFFNIGKVMALLFKALAKSIKERREREEKEKRRVEIHKAMHNLPFPETRMEREEKAKKR